MPTESSNVLSKLKRTVGKTKYPAPGGTGGAGGEGGGEGGGVGGNGGLGGEGGAGGLGGRSVTLSFREDVSRSLVYGFIRI